jgi:VanZ family protein
LVYWLPLLAWLGIMLYFTTAPHPYAPLEGTGWRPGDAPSHVIGYLIMGLLLMRLACRLHGCSYRTVAWALLIAVVYATLDELHQIPIESRGFAVMDIVCNAAGATIAAGITVALWRRRSAPH